MLKKSLIFKSTCESLMSTNYLVRRNNQNQIKYGNLDKISRVANVIVPKFYFSNGKVEIEGNQKKQMIKTQPWFSEYETATKYTSSNKYSDALKSYYKVISMMEQKNQKGQAYYYRIFQKILQICTLLNRPLQAQQNLYKLIKVKKSLQKNPILVYEDYQNLMIHQTNHNVEKAIKLGKALLSQSQINNLPINHQKHIRMLLGNCYLLTDNYADAKKKYGEVLQMKPTHSLKGITLNNLSLACWWHKNPLFKASSQIPQYEEVRINRDYKQAKQLLMNSIGSLQNIQQLSEMQAMMLQQLLNQHTDSILKNFSQGQNKEKNSSYHFKQKQTLKPLYNLIQYYIYNDPIQKPLIIAWMRILLKAASRFNNELLIDQIKAKYFLLNNQFEELYTFSKQSIQKYENKANEDQTNERNKISIKQNILQMYKLKKLVLRVSKSSFQQKGIKNLEEMQKIEKIVIKLQKQLLQKDPFIFKRSFILSQQMSFMKKEEFKF